MNSINSYGIEQFCRDYPGMTVGPFRGAVLIIKGEFAFSSQVGKDEIDDSYQLEISVPPAFPRQMPTVRETGNKIPRDGGGNHINRLDDSLCLGSPIRLLTKLSQKPTLVGFAESCLVPYLHATSRKRTKGGGFVFGELAHGSEGIVEDYKDLFKLENKAQVLAAMTLLGVKKRVANKRQCPCKCGLRLGRCSLHKRLNVFREIASRAWFKANYATVK